MKKSISSIIFILYQFLLAAQTDSIVYLINNGCIEAKMTLLTQQNEKANNKNYLLLINSSVINDIKKDKQLSSDYLKEIIRFNKKLEIDTIKYSTSLKFIDSLIQLTKNSLQFYELLLEERYLIYKTNHKLWQDEIEVALKELALIKSKKIYINELDLAKYSFQLAKFYENRNLKNDAQQCYQDIFYRSFGFVNIKEPDIRNLCFDNHIKSGKGIIDMCRGDKEKMKKLSPYAFLNIELYPYYEKAMKEVGLPIEN